MKSKPVLVSWLERLIHRDSSRMWLFGITVRSVRFADHRSGNEAIQVCWGIGPICGMFHPVTWPATKCVSKPRILSLREVLEANHPPDDAE